VQYLYAVNKCRKIAEENLDYVDRKTYTQRLKSSLEEYGNLDEGTKTRWEKIKRDHLARQPAIKQHIIDSPFDEIQKFHGQMLRLKSAIGVLLGPYGIG
jgi:hypothetical protein